MKFSIKDFFRKFDQILRKSLMENFIFYALQHSRISTYMSLIPSQI